MKKFLHNTDEILLQRSDLKVIHEMIPEGARILDLGCGSGTFLQALKNQKNARVTGVEIDHQILAQCVERGVPVIQANLDTDLADFSADTQTRMLGHIITSYFMLVCKILFTDYLI